MSKKFLIRRLNLIHHYVSVTNGKILSRVINNSVGMSINICSFNMHIYCEKHCEDKNKGRRT